MKLKILSLDELAVRAEQMRAANQKLVLTNGCFDLLHVGHVRYLEQARALGDALAVAVNGDDSVRTLKGPDRPINSAADRAEVLAALESVDFVTVFSAVRAKAVINAVRPALYAKGGDYSIETLDPEEVEALREAGSEVRIVPLTPGKSTSGILARMRKF
jgi:rfaE bifunctional protein nucleotidyltransferase chain/domain